jgi:hypothetical protein
MKYTCEKCEYFTNNVTNYKKHLTTNKHLKYKDVVVNLQQYKCDVCDLNFNNRMSLWRHKKKCNETGEQNVTMNIHEYSVPNEKVNNNFELVTQTILDNQAVLTGIMKAMMSIIEQLKQPQLQSNSNVLHENATMNNNSHNTVLMMLNTNHSHVMPMDTFIKNMEASFERTLSALDKHISEQNRDIFMDNLAGVAPKDRPIHCSDAKRETYYVKGQTEWYKDHGEILIKAIRAMYNLNINNLMELQKNKLLEIENNDRIGTEFMEIFHNISGPEKEKDIELIKNKTMALINQLIPISDIK